METGKKEVQEAVDKIYVFAANLMVNEKKSAAETKEALINQGLSNESAKAVVENLEKQIKETKKERAGKDMMYGALWCIGGIMVTAVTYTSATGGGTYVVAWGAILFGAFQFVSGLFNFV